MADEDVAERLTQLETAVRRATETITRLRDDNQRLGKEVAQLREERRHSIAQIDSILKDIEKLDLG